MKKAILATKVGMTQIFDEKGTLVPVTVLQAGPCVVTQVKTVANDGYSAVQVGFVDKREKLVNKPVKGHFDKAGVSYKRFVREFRLMMLRITQLRMRLRQTFSQQAKRLMLLQSPKVRASRALLRDTDSPEDLWLMVLSTIVMLVLTALQQHQDAYSRVSTCQVIWDMYR